MRKLVCAAAAAFAALALENEDLATDGKILLVSQASPPPSRAAVRRMARRMGPGARLATICCLLGKVAG